MRERRKRKAMTKCFCCHPTSSFRTTYTKYATSSSSLLSKKGARRDRLRQFEIYPNPTVRKTPKKSLSNARNARPILPLKKTTEHLVRKRTKILPRDGVFSQKNKKESFLPPLKQNKTKISLIKSNEKNKTLHYSVLVSLS